MPGVQPRPGESEEARTERAIEQQFIEIRQHLGNVSTRGRVGVGLNYPYTVMVEGEGPDRFRVRADTARLYDINVKVAQKLRMPVLVGLNGADWAGPAGPFNAYWKTADGGKYLSRYKDGRVNESIKQPWENISGAVIEPYLGSWGYDKDAGKDALLLTKSPEAKPFCASRLAVLRLALDFWRNLDRKYPATIQAITTDSEVQGWSFRLDHEGRALATGFEDFMILPFCRQYGIKSCREYMSSHHFNYRSEEDRRWFRFRAAAHRAFVQSSVDAIRAVFPDRQIFTHQFETLDGEYLYPYRAYDFGSPQETAFVTGANSGFTFYIHNGDDKRFKAMVSQYAAKAKAAGRLWGIMEFHPGKTWNGSKAALRDYTRDILLYLQANGVSAIALLAWEDTPLDRGWKGSGADDGLKLFLEETPKP
jgi:hypothetical protein